MPVFHYNYMLQCKCALSSVINEFSFCDAHKLRDINCDSSVLLLHTYFHITQEIFMYMPCAKVMTFAFLVV